ncbi:MAG: hypothetical protein ACK5Y2_04605 [Bdellovibrionales bacterium]
MNLALRTLFAVVLTLTSVASASPVVYQGRETKNSNLWRPNFDTCQIRLETAGRGLRAEVLFQDETGATYTEAVTLERVPKYQQFFQWLLADKADYHKWGEERRRLPDPRLFEMVDHSLNFEGLNVIENENFPQNLEYWLTVVHTDLNFMMKTSDLVCRATRVE